MLGLTLEEVEKCETQAVQALFEIQRIKQNLMEVSGMSLKENESEAKTKEVMIPFVAYEMQLERNLEEKNDMAQMHLDEKCRMREHFEAEKDKMRKHFKMVYSWMAGIIIALLLCVFGTVIWFFSNYEVFGVTQDGDGLNNYAYSTEQGDVIYEPAYSDDCSEKAS